MAESFPASIDQFLNMDLLADANNVATPPLQTPTGTPVVHVEGEDETAGMSFAEMFRHYLAPEVAKLPSSFVLPPLPPLPSPNSEHPFAPENDFAGVTYLPTAPGSPVGSFSPSSDNSGSAGGAFGTMSPLGELELDLDLSAESMRMGGMEAEVSPARDWAIDPSFFSAAPAVGLAEPVTPESVEAEEPMIVIKEEPVNHSPSLLRQTSRQVSAAASLVDHEDDSMAVDSDDSEDEEATKPAFKPTKKAATKLAKTSVAAFATATLHATSTRSTLAPVPEWTDKPDPETYGKLNSKEKRQMRNKISARNFRHRRKEYITTLEEEISQRDTIIGQLRDEVGNMRSDNQELRGEVSMLKTKWDEMMEKMSSFTMPSAAAKSPVASASADEWALDSSASGRKGTRSSSGIAKPNMHKDVASAGKRTGTGSWTTSGMGTGYNMPVHTTLLPEFNLNPKPTASPFPSLNFNPSLNNLTPSQLSRLPSLTAHLRNSTATNGGRAFDDFFSTNPLWLRPENVEEYRGALYGKVAHNAAGAAAADAAAASKSTASPPAFRPAFFSSPSSYRSSPADALLQKSPRDRSSSYYSSSDLLAFQSPRIAEERNDEQMSAYVASLAAQTLCARMASAFIDAFAGGEGGMMSPEKVVSVLEGRANVQIVASAGARAEEGLESGMASLSVAGGASGTAASCSFDDVCKRWMGKKSPAPSS